MDLSVSGPMAAHAQQVAHVCAAHGSRHVTCVGSTGGTLSAGNTLTRLGSRHTAVEYAVPHHFHIHHGTKYVEYHQPQLSFSDDDSSSEPGYATGKFWVIAVFVFSFRLFSVFLVFRIFHWRSFFPVCFSMVCCSLHLLYLLKRHKFRNTAQ